jgi:hypothetical protein
VTGRRQTHSNDPVGSSGPLRSLIPGALALLAALPLAFLILRITARFAHRPEMAVTIVGALILLLLPLPAVAAAVASRGTATPARVALLVLLSATVLVTAIDLHWLWAQVVFPADILIWSESDFVNDILKLRIGYPLYTAQVNNESFTYPPGAQALTLGISTVLGRGESLLAYRAIQVAFTLVAAIIATLCCRRILMMSGGYRLVRDSTLWNAIWLPSLVLLATNGLTNPFVANLHNDALAQLLTVAAFWVLLEYAATRDRRLLVVMAIIPGVGFLVKQSMAIWALLYCLYLLVWDRPGSLRRVAVVSVAGLGGVALAVGAGYFLWGEAFFYWIFTVLGRHAVLPIRSVQHVLAAWAFFAAGLLAALALLRGPALRSLIGPWVIWLLLMSAEAYTSGIAWMLNHMGPGSLIAGTWLLAALAKVWSDAIAVPVTSASRVELWLRPALAAAAAVLALSGLHTVRIPTVPIPDDAERYVQQIEREFASADARGVLLDVGSWVYAKDDIVMKDRAPSIGERGFSETGDFSGILRRIQQRRYAKILVRSFHSDDFWYDHAMWAKPSGIRRALGEHYREVGTIPAVRGDSRYLFREISILIPLTR